MRPGGNSGRQVRALGLLRNILDVALRPAEAVPMGRSRAARRRRRRRLLNAAWRIPLVAALVGTPLYYVVVVRGRVGYGGGGGSDGSGGGSGGGCAPPSFLGWLRGTPVVRSAAAGAQAVRAAAAGGVAAVARAAGSGREPGWLVAWLREVLAAGVAAGRTGVGCVLTVAGLDKQPHQKGGKAAAYR